MAIRSCLLRPRRCRTKEVAGRLSSLQFRRSRADGEEGDDETPVSWVGKEAPYLRVAGPGARYGMGHGAAPISLAAGYVAALLRIIVPLSRVEPVAVDVARTDRSGRPTPLLIPLDQSAGGAGIAFHLQVTEQISPTQDRLLEVDLLGRRDRWWQRLLCAAVAGTVLVDALHPAAARRPW